MKLLVIDTSYTYDAIKKKKLFEAIYSRDLDGYFSKVWSVHPFSTFLRKDNSIKKYNRPSVIKLNSSHYFIEGKIGKYKFLKYFKIINFILSQIELFFFLLKLIKNEKIKFIKASDPLYNSLFAYFLSKFSKIVFIVRVSANFDKIYADTKKPIMPKLFFFRSIEKIIEKFIFKKANFAMAPNVDNLNYAIKNGLNKKKSEIVRYGSLIDKGHLINPNLRKNKNFFKKELNLNSNCYFLIYVGRLEKVKRVDDLVLIFKGIKKKNIKLIIVGDGSLKNNIKTQIKKNNLDDQIFLIGEKDQDWLSKCLPNCSCFMATHTGRALAEAAFAGLPVVGYDIDWHSELIHNGKNGYLVKAGDIAAFSRSIEYVLTNKKLYKTFSINIRAEAEKILSPEKIKKIEINCYEKAKKI